MFLPLPKNKLNQRDAETYIKDKNYLERRIQFLDHQSGYLNVP